MRMSRWHPQQQQQQQEPLPPFQQSEFTTFIDYDDEEEVLSAITQSSFSNHPTVMTTTVGSSSSSQGAAAAARLTPTTGSSSSVSGGSSSHGGAPITTSAAAAALKKFRRPAAVNTSTTANLSSSSSRNSNPIHTAGMSYQIHNTGRGGGQESLTSRSDPQQQQQRRSLNKAHSFSNRFSPTLSAQQQHQSSCASSTVSSTTSSAVASYLRATALNASQNASPSSSAPSARTVTRTSSFSGVNKYSNPYQQNPATASHVGRKAVESPTLPSSTRSFGRTMTPPTPTSSYRGPSSQPIESRQPKSPSPSPRRPSYGRSASSSSFPKPSFAAAPSPRAPWMPSTTTTTSSYLPSPKPGALQSYSSSSFPTTPTTPSKSPARGFVGKHATGATPLSSASPSWVKGVKSSDRSSLNHLSPPLTTSNTTNDRAVESASPSWVKGVRERNQRRMDSSSSASPPPPSVTNASPFTTAKSMRTGSGDRGLDSPAESPRVATSSPWKPTSASSPSPSLLKGTVSSSPFVTKSKVGGGGPISSPPCWSNSNKGESNNTPSSSASPSWAKKGLVADDEKSTFSARGEVRRMVVDASPAAMVVPQNATSPTGTSSIASVSTTTNKQTPSLAQETCTHVWVLPPTANGKTGTAVSSFHTKSMTARRHSRNGTVGSNSSNNLDDDDSRQHQHHHGGRVAWAWKRGLLLEQTRDKLVVQLLEDDEDQLQDDFPIDGPFPKRRENNIKPSSSSSQTITYGGDALGVSVLLTNEFDVDETTGQILPPDDLITLTHLNEPAVLESLLARYQQDIIYTNTGSVLLALNPFQNVRGLYGESAMKAHWQAAESGHYITPHVYGIADAAFRCMRRQLEAHHSSVSYTRAHQSILVSGESGAGKTVTTKFVMKYLAALSQRSSLKEPPERAYRRAAAAVKQASSPPNQNQQALQQQDDNLTSLTLLSGSSSIEGQVLQSNPILESFGNARTVRNDNSSRFGKFIEIQFSSTGRLVGACIETYLLEKVRLVHQSPGERNYHIFYELLSGAMDARQLSHYFIARTAHPEDFKLTASGTYDRRDGVADNETYKALRHACAAMKFSNQELHSVFSVTAALLHASNITLLSEEEEEEQCCLDPSNVHLTPVCHLLGIAPEDLELALCQQTLTVGRNQTVTKRLSLEKAVKGLEALLKAIYGALFQYLVRRINNSVAYRETEQAPPAASVRVLDIFGFESFQINSFEQLCINYCNETLQQQFNAFVLKNEQAEYEREGIEWTFIDFEENQDVLDLIDKRGQGILSLLDDQCRAPGPSDKAFFMQVSKSCSGVERLSIARQQEANLQFSIQHYAGLVEYTSYGFVEKNRDELSKEGTELVKNSSNPFVQELAIIMEESSQEAPAASQPQIGNNTTLPDTPRTLRRSDSSVGRATVGGQFRRQLRHLRTKIDETTPHYIRCLKPNDYLVPGHFDTSVVAEQLRCGGILEAVRVARAGFTQHYSHVDFVHRYRTLAWKEMARKECLHQPTTPSFLNARNNSFQSTSPPNTFSSSAVTGNKKTPGTNTESKAQCNDLVKILYRKILEQELEDHYGLGDGRDVGTSESWDDSPAKAKSYAYKPAPQPSWTKAPFSRDSNNNSNTPRVSTCSAKSTSTASVGTTSSPTPGWKRGGPTSSDFAKVGIQIGKTKVFLRHKAFEVLERLRSRIQSKSATKLNSVFRMYLARCAYIPYRDAFRQEMRQRKMMFERANEFKESKENDDDFQFYEGVQSPSSHDGGSDSSYMYNQARLSSVINLATGVSESLVDKWSESQIRNAIHNPTPRHEWGKAAPSNGTFKWVLCDGLWVQRSTLV